MDRPPTNPIDSAELPLIEVDLDGIIYAVSLGFCSLVRRGRDEMVGQSVLDITHPDDRGPSREVWRRLEATGLLQTLEKRYTRGGGGYVWVRLLATMALEPRRVLGHVLDISDLVAAREDAVQSARRLDALIANSADVVAVVDSNGRLRSANPAAERLLGWQVADQVGADVFDLVHPDDLGAVLVSFAETLDTPSGLLPPITFRIATAEGGWRYIEASGSNLLHDLAVLGVIVNAHDVTDRVLLAKQGEASRVALALVLARVTESRDPYTAGHQESVATFATAIAVALELPSVDQAALLLGAQLDDIGKIALPSEVLTKSGRLTDVAFALVATHPRVGLEILKDALLPPEALDVVLHHHERLDGSGYPDGLAGEEIGLFARIVAVADVVDAISAPRPYRPSLGMDGARAELEVNRGRLYDASVVDAALTLPALQVQA